MWFGHMNALVMRGRAGETYNVGSGRAVPISEILNKILVHSKAKIEVETQKRQAATIRHTDY